MSTFHYTTTAETPALRFTEESKISRMPSLHDQTSNCLQSILAARARSFPSRCMYFYPLGSTGSIPHPISYSFLYDKATSISRKLASLSKFRDDSPVLIHLDGHWDTILLFWAVLLANGLPVISTPLSNIEDHRNQHLQHLSHLLESPICITEADSLHLFTDSGHAFELYTIESVMGVEIDYPSLPIADPLWPPWRGVNRKAYNSKQSLASPAILMLTSGSTGNAKLVPLTHKQIIAAVSGKASVRQLPPGGSFFNWVGLDHVASLVEIHIQALWMGADQVHAQAADVVASPRLFLDLLSRHGVCRSFAPNFFLAKLVTAVVDDDATWDLSKLTVLASGGEPNEVSTCVAASSLLARYGARHDCITPGFGMTETCAGAIFNLECPDHDASKGLTVASLGRCMPGIEMRVTSSATGKENVPGASGHLELRGDVVFDGYYRNPAATAEAFTSDGWFQTGDLAVIDATGNLNLTGRTKDVININGIKIATADIQASLEASLGDTCASRVLSFPSRPPGAYTEQITVAYIPREWPPTTEDMVEVDSRAVQACMMVSTACMPLIFPFGSQSLPFLPTTTLGKVSGAKMRVLFESGVFDQDAAYHRNAVSEFKKKQQHMSSDATLTEAEGLLQSDFAEIMGVESLNFVDVNTSVFELGLTSMDLIRLKHRIDARLGFAMATSMILRHPTVRSLAAALAKFEREYALLRASDATTGPASTDNPPVASEAEYDPVVTLRSSGSKAPLWLVHPGVGEVFVFVGLAQHMQVDDRPMYAFRARGFEPGQEGFRSINEAVVTYVSEIRRRQPQGPYALAGYSYGTMLAFEIAKSLESGGEEVGFLGSFNLPPHIKTRMRQLSWNMCILHLAQFLGLITESCVEGVLTGDSGYLDASTAAALAHVLDIADMTRMRELGLGSRELARWADVAHGLQSMAVDYEPSGNVAVIDVFHAEPLEVAASSREEWVTDQLGKWRDFCRTKPRFHEVGGAHYTMINQDHVGPFSETLREALRARGI